MLYRYSFLIVLFFIYSFLGYIAEIISVSRVRKKIVLSRGYLIGPYLPIFGFGAILMIGFLDKYSHDVFALFFLSMTLCCLLEFFTSVILEKIFKLRWWDYSNKKYNINGRICLENGLWFGLAGVLLVKVINPFFVGLLLKISVKEMIVIGVVIGFILFSDFLLSTYTILKLKIDTSIYSDKDSTAIVRKEVLESLQKYNIFHRRLLNAFPHILNNKNIFDIMKLIHIDNKK